MGIKINLTECLCKHCSYTLYSTTWGDPLQLCIKIVELHTTCNGLLLSCRLTTDDSEFFTDNIASSSSIVVRSKRHTRPS